MKTLFFVLVIPFALFFSESSEFLDYNEPALVEENAFEEDHGEIKILVKVTFGRQSKDCKGFGLCTTIVVTIDDEDIPEKSMFATAVLNENGQITGIFFRKKDMSLRVLKEYFSGSHFLMEEPYEATLSNKKGKKAYLKLKKGNYKMKKTGEGYYVATMK